MNCSRFITVATILLPLYACTTMTSAQSGRTVGDGNFRAYTGLTMAPGPAAELDVRYGVSESAEIGAGLA